jgi:hypothetical protein
MPTITLPSNKGDGLYFLYFDKGTTLYFGFTIYHILHNFSDKWADHNYENHFEMMKVNILNGSLGNRNQYLKNI